MYDGMLVHSNRQAQHFRIDVPFQIGDYLALVCLGILHAPSNNSKCLRLEEEDIETDFEHYGGFFLEDGDVIEGFMLDKFVFGDEGLFEFVGGHYWAVRLWRSQ